MVAGALVLGAAGEVRIVVVAAAVCAALTLGWIEQSHRNWTAPPRRGIALVLLSLLAGAAATGAVLLQAQKDPRHPALFAQGRDYPGIKPVWTDPLTTSSEFTRCDSRRPAAPEASYTSAHVETRREAGNPVASRPGSEAHTVDLVLRGRGDRAVRNHPRRVDRGAAARHAIRMAASAASAGGRRACRPGHRRLGMDAECGCEACRLPLAVDVSPDVVVAGRAMDDVPAGVYTPLRRLAAATTKAAFARDQSLSAGEVTAAWRAAGKADESARASSDEARSGAPRVPWPALRSH